jgi:large subunit ribosomal protein L35
LFAGGIMPKLKTNKGVAKRFKLTKKGKIIRQKAGGRHLLGGKSRKRKRQLRKAALVSRRDKKAIRALLPY